MQRRDFILLSFLLGLALLLLTVDITKPFYGHHDWNGVWYGTIARNHLKMGFLETKLGSVKSLGEHVVSGNDFFTHYPPLFPLILAAGISLLGDSEWTLRITTILFSLNTIIGIYLLGKYLRSTAVAFIASLIALVTPLFLYFGKMPVHEIILLPFMIYVVYFYLRWFTEKKPWQWKALVTCLISSLLITWPAYPLTFFLSVHYFLLHPEKDKLKQVLLLNVLPISFFLLHLVHVKLLTGSFLAGGIVEIFLSRINSAETNSMYDVTFARYFINEVSFFLAYFTKIVMGLTGLWGLVLVWHIFKKHSVTFIQSVLLILLAMGLFYIVLFRQAAFIHDYLMYYILPFMALSSAFVIDWVLRIIPGRLPQQTLLLVILVAIAWERHAFVKALLETNHSQKGYSLGKFIDTQHFPGDRVVVGSTYYGDFYSPFVNYYAHTAVAFMEIAPPEELKQFKLIVRPKAHDAFLPETKQLLVTHCDTRENADFIWHTNCNLQAGK